MIPLNRPLSEQEQKALDDYAASNPPDFEDSAVVLREVVLVTKQGWKPMVFSKSFVDAVTEWNRGVDERRKQAEEKESQRNELKRKKSKKRENTIIDLPDISASDL